jgi:hypothetical protein
MVGLLGDAIADFNRATKKSRYEVIRPNPVDITCREPDPLFAVMMAPVPYGHGDGLAQDEPGNRVELPAEWTEGLGLSGLVTLKGTNEGILIGPRPRFTSDDIFASRLSIQPTNSEIPPDVSEISGDDLLG